MSKRGPKPTDRPPRRSGRVMVCVDCGVVVWPVWTEALGSFYVGGGRIHGPSPIEPVSTADYLA